jgi:hypothetical protein
MQFDDEELDSSNAWMDRKIFSPLESKDTDSHEKWET